MSLLVHVMLPQIKVAFKSFISAIQNVQKENIEDKHTYQGETPKRSGLIRK